ncbi:hypothetical protein DY218_32025 [Streptomyces triticagri]|uniref:DNA primase n=1 Tax=Streptomyces triticagri TaxID=2293568 RepID=A0A372LVH2_9ACTN|nr:hypothetical protein [Streptomyces triticagri]RFU82666.1 hypothetical protein DY218_32025 [Streptomyces triticagri]
MTGNVKTGVALVGGYLLGRTKKARMAIGLGMFLAGRKLDLDPARLGKLVANSPVLGGLNDQVRKELVEATKTAATGALTKRATGLADSLQDRTRALNDPLRGRGETGEEDDGRDEESGPDEGLADAPAAGAAGAADAAAEARDEDEKPPPRRRAAGKTAGGGAGKAPAKSARTGSRTASSGRTKSPAGSARKSAAGAATKSASKAGKKTTSGARKSRGGGSNG